MLFLFEARSEAGARSAHRAYLAGLCAAGLVAWTYVLGLGAVPLDFHDWADITVPRLTFLQQALQAGEWPLHMERSNALHGVTERFLAIPDVITTPQSILLLWMPVGAFVIFDALMHYSLGVVGLLLLRRYFDWSLAAFTLAFLLVLFNGHVLAHYTVGHFTWGAYFLFPLLAWLLLRFLDGDDRWQSMAGFAAIMFYMVLAGGQHHVTWVLLLLVVLAPFCRTRLSWLAGAAIASVLLSAVRLLPPALELDAFARAGFSTDVHGYPSLLHLVESLVYLRREVPVPSIPLPANLLLFDQRYWEYNTYVGVAGAAAIAAGVWLWLSDGRRYRALIVPLVAMTTLSMGSLFRVPRLSGLPLLMGERATSRMFSLVLVLLIVIAVTFLDQRLRHLRHEARARTLALLMLLFVAIDIAGSARLQRVAISSGMFGPSPYNPSQLVTRVDPGYVAVLQAGAALSATTAVVLILLVRRERRAAMKRPPVS
jgi:hypothetical protein